ncbi:PAS domain-containing protein [Streptomyces beigongshangae]|uniref:PAS domain-containing protein n=1 Tax=Streptomyces beigongshangae TaxID=2841597 RepID=UPI0027DEB862|nr:PAS domain-containing protein [Streptomyces sp. REN17]
MSAPPRTAGASCSAFATWPGHRRPLTSDTTSGRQSSRVVRSACTGCAENSPDSPRPHRGSPRCAATGTDPTPESHRSTTTAAGTSGPDFRQLFECALSPLLVLDPDFTIVEANHAYREATGRDRSIIGRLVFDVFPDDPEDPAADGVANLRRSLEAVVSTARTDTIAVPRGRIRRPSRQAPAARGPAGPAGPAGVLNGCPAAAGRASARTPVPRRPYAAGVPRANGSERESPGRWLDSPVP